MATLVANGSDFIAALIRRWRAGERDAVEAALTPFAHDVPWRLLLAAVRFIRLLDRDPAAQPPAVPAMEQFVVLHAILDFGHVEAARVFVARTDPAPLMPSVLADLRSVVAGLPALPGDGTHGAPIGHRFSDDPAADVQIVPKPGAPCLLIVFAGALHKFYGPLNLMHEWFGRLDASVAYLRDFDRLFYLHGVRAMGGGYSATVRGLREIAARFGATRIACIGGSSGGFGALRLGLDLGAAAVLSLAGPTTLEASLPELLDRQRKRGTPVEPIDPARLNLPTLYALAPHPPRLRLAFAADNERDRMSAERMRHLPHVELVPVPGVAEHIVLPYLIADGSFAAHLRWLVHTPSPDTRAPPLRPRLRAEREGRVAQQREGEAGDRAPAATIRSGRS